MTNSTEPANEGAEPANEGTEPATGSAERAPAARELRITGDDFGASTGVNAAIAECAERGVLTHASLMVGAPAFRDAVARAHTLPQLAVGLHLVVCGGRPSSAPERIPDLVDAHGRFPDDPTRVGLRLWSRRRRARAQLETEIRAQIEAFLETGLSLGHIDGHRHLHQHPVVFDALRRVLSEPVGRGDLPLERVHLPVERVRLMHEDAIARRRVEPGEGSLLGEVIPTVHAWLARWHRRRAEREPAGAQRSPLQSDERVYGLRASGRVDEAYLLWLIPRLCAPRVEIYSHPGSGPKGASERDALCSPRVRAAIDAAGYTLERTPRPTC